MAEWPENCGSGEDMKLSSGSLFGIGASTPLDALHLDSGGDSALKLRFDADRTSADVAIGAIEAYWDDTRVAHIQLKTGDDTTNKDDGEIAFRTATGGSIAERMRIDQDGNVGIGTTSPNAKLELFDTTEQFRLSYDASNRATFTVESDGDLNIATAGTNADVDIAPGTGSVGITGTHASLKTNGSNDSSIYIDRGSTSYNSTLMFQTGAVGDWLIGTGRQGTDSNLSIEYYDGSWHDVLFINKSGHVGIGTTNPGVELAVDGTIEAKTDVKIGDLTVPDFVFDENYKLLKLSEIRDFIQKNNHLPDIPSAEEYEKAGGVKIGELNSLLLRKIEELTLYLLNQEEKIKNLEIKLA